MEHLHLQMAGFELRTSGVGFDRTTNCPVVFVFSKHLYNLYNYIWLDSNCGPLVSGSTEPPTAQLCLFFKASIHTLQLMNVENDHECCPGI